MRVSRSERVRRASLARSSCYKCGGKWRFCRQQQRGAASDAVGQQAGWRATRSLARSPSWPVVAWSSDGPPCFVRVGGGCNYNLDGQKMAVSNAIFSEKRRTDGRRRKRRLARFACFGGGGKSDDFWPGASANESCGRERDREGESRSPSVVRHSVHGAFLHVQTHISTKSDGGGGGRKRGEGKLQMNRFSRRSLFLMTIPAGRGRDRGVARG